MATDEELALATALGDEAATAELVGRYQHALYGFVLRRTGCAQAEAEDLTQEVWLRVVAAIGRFDPRRRFSTWLFQIAVNLCRDRARRERVRGVASDLDTDTIAAPEGSTDRRLDLTRLLEELPVEQREVLMLRFYADMSEAQIAEVLEIPAGTVKSRAHHGLARLAAAAAQEKESG